MRIKKFFITFSVLGFFSMLIPASAGVFALSFLSRADCINNESITWDLTDTWQMEVWSFQREVEKNYYVIEVDNGYNANRVAAVCWGCGLEGEWEVQGYHYVTPPSGFRSWNGDPDGEMLLENNCAQWLYTGDGNFMAPCQTTRATGCNATDWRGS